MAYPVLNDVSQTTSAGRIQKRQLSKSNSHSLSNLGTKYFTWSGVVVNRLSNKKKKIPDQKFANFCGANIPNIASFQATKLPHKFPVYLTGSQLQRASRRQFQHATDLLSHFIFTTTFLRWVTIITSSVHIRRNIWRVLIIFPKAQNQNGAEL